MSMTWLKVRSGMTLAEYLESVGPSVNKFVLHLPGCRPVTVDPRHHGMAFGVVQTLLGTSIDDWRCTETAFEFGDEEPLITAHVRAEPRPPPPAAPVDVPID